MRRLASALALGMLVAGLVAAPVLAKADKVDMPPVSWVAGLPGDGAVIFNNSSGPNNLEVTVQLKGVKADFAYDVFLFVDNAWYGAAPVATITTNGAGNATFHMNAKVAEGKHLLGVDITNHGSFSDQYLAPVYTGGIWGIWMTFE